MHSDLVAPLDLPLLSTKAPGKAAPLLPPPKASQAMNPGAPQAADSAVPKVCKRPRPPPKAKVPLSGERLLALESTKMLKSVGDALVESGAWSAKFRASGIPEAIATPLEASLVQAGSLRDAHTSLTTELAEAILRHRLNNARCWRVMAVRNVMPSGWWP